MVVLDKFEMAEAKTRVVADFLKRFELSDALFVVPSQDDNFALSARNIPTVTVLPTEGLNVYDVLNHETLVITKDSIAKLQETLR